MNRRRPLALAVGLATALALSACTSAGDPEVASPGTGGPSTSAPGTTAPPKATKAPPRKPTAAPTTKAPPALPRKVTSPAVIKAVQTQLTALKYYAGAIDGETGGGTRSAVMAFQKVNGLGTDGTVGPKTLAALKRPKAPVLRDTRPADRVEVDLTKQVLYVVKGGSLARILPVSSGNGERYSQKDGDRATALTPAGYFTIERRITGVREADLGTLYDPQYFYRGWAIHGSNSVPSYPASHGCVRVTRADAKFLLDALTVGMTVHLYGGTHTFKAGSSAPGTDNPTGDEAPTPAPTTATPTPTVPKPKPATPAPKPKPTATPTATVAPPTVIPTP